MVNKLRESLEKNEQTVRQIIEVDGFDMFIGEQLDSQPVPKRSWFFKHTRRGVIAEARNEYYGLLLQEYLALNAFGFFYRSLLIILSDILPFEGKRIRWARREGDYMLLYLGDSDYIKVPCAFYQRTETVCTETCGVDLAFKNTDDRVALCYERIEELIQKLQRLDEKEERLC